LTTGGGGCDPFLGCDDPQSIPEALETTEEENEQEVGR